MVDLVGAGDHCRHGVLVTGRDDGEEGKSSQGEVVDAAGDTALVIAVWVQAGRGGRKEGWNKGLINLKCFGVFSLSTSQ